MDFNPRGCISLDTFPVFVIYHNAHFNPRGCISLDGGCIYRGGRRATFQSTRLYKPRLIFKPIHQIIVIFQSTRLYKPRLSIPLDGNTLNIFQSTRLYKPRPFASSTSSHLENFNPRGCISLDEELADDILRHGLVQSTRLYKPRLVTYVSQNSSTVFQSTRLYKPRL